jgi:hypothetical protein
MPRLIFAENDYFCSSSLPSFFSVHASFFAFFPSSLLSSLFRREGNGRNGHYGENRSDQG